MGFAYDTAVEPGVRPLTGVCACGRVMHHNVRGAFRTLCDACKRGRQEARGAAYRVQSRSLRDKQRLDKIPEGVVHPALWPAIRDRIYVKRCGKCAQTKIQSDYTDATWRRWCGWCKECLRVCSREWLKRRKSDPFEASVATLLKAAHVRTPGTDITEAWVRSAVTAGCAVTREPFTFDGPRHPWQPSLDRIDCAKGYTRDNVQAVCLIYNLAKNKYAHADVLRLAALLLGVG